MKYILENPTFTNEPIEIDNYDAINQINSYINKPIKLGDEILLLLDNTFLKLQLVCIDKEEYKFKI